MDFAGKVAFVTGGATGIGKAVVEIIVHHGGKAVVTDINTKALEALQDCYPEAVVACCCDVTDEAAVRETVAKAQREMGKIDILINNAGIFDVDRAPFVEQTPDIWKKKIDVNIWGTLYPTHAVLPQMMAQGYGRIINVASVAGTYGIREMVDYSLTKGAIIAFTAGLAREVGPYGITVNAVSPGNINTRLELPELSYLNRSGTPEECARVIAFLASDDASFVSGANYVVDGSRKKI